LKVLFLSHRVPFPPNKGEKIRTFHQLKHLKEQGHQVNVCAPIENCDEVTHFTELNEKYCENTTYHQLPYKPLRLLKGLLKRQALSVANFYSDDLQVKLDMQIESQQFDVIICTSSAMAEYIYRSNALSKFPSKPLLLMDFMDLDSDKWRQYASSSTMPMRWVYQRESTILSAYEVKITRDFNTSFFIADAEVNIFKSQEHDYGKVLTMGNGMDTELYKPALSPANNAAPVFLFTGVMDYKPNIDSVVWFVEDIWPSILNEYPEARFIIAGMNPTNIVNDLTKFSGVEVTGFVDDILPYYHKSNYFVAPFRIARGVQNKVLQAFACGLPVISTSMGAEGINCHDTKDILVANNQHQFLAAIKALESDKELKEKIIQNALQLIHQQYSWEGMLDVLDQELAQIHS
jgi:sugar transferase (PEP-CTERM/EpsH1 system associated)